MPPSPQRWSEHSDIGDLDAVVALEAIRDLVSRYNSYGDSGRFEQLDELFAPDAAMEVNSTGEPALYEGRDALMKIFPGARDRIAAGPGASTPGFVRHYTATHQIDLVDATHATGRCYFAVIVRHGLDHWGRYIDRYVRAADGRWRFEHRRAIVDGRAEISWFVAE
jgi:hypothetical protein